MNILLCLSWAAIALIIGAISHLTNKNREEYKTTQLVVICLTTIGSATLFGFLFLTPIGMYESTLIALLLISCAYMMLNPIFNGSLVALFFVSWFFSSSAMMNATDFAERIDVQESAKASFQEVKETEQRIVPKPVALDRARKAINGRNEEGQLSSMYKIDESSMIIQEVNDELYYIAPLTWQGFSTWLFNSYDIIGYVKVNATNIYSEGELVTKNPDGSDIAIKMTNSGYFGSNISRYIADKEITSRIGQKVFMIDDSGYPYFVAYNTKSEVGFDGYTPDGLYLIDPQTKTHKFYENDDIPVFVDMVADEATLLSMLSDWGKYREGFLASFGSKIVLEPTSYNHQKELFFIDATDTLNGKAFFTGMASSKSNGNLAAMIFIDVKTLDTNIYYSEKEAVNEQAVISSVNSALELKADKWEPTQPIPYRVFGEIDVWLTPIISRTASGQKIEAYAYTKVWGTQKSQWDVKLSNALTKIVTVSNDDSTVSNLVEKSYIEGDLRTVYFSGDNVYLTLYGDNTIYECNHQENVQCRGIKIDTNISFESMFKSDNESIVISFNEDPVLVN